VSSPCASSTTLQCVWQIRRSVFPASGRLAHRTSEAATIISRSRCNPSEKSPQNSRLHRGQRKSRSSLTTVWDPVRTIQISKAVRERESTVDFESLGDSQFSILRSAGRSRTNSGRRKQLYPRRPRPEFVFRASRAPETRLARASRGDPFFRSNLLRVWGIFSKLFCGQFFRLRSGSIPCGLK